MIVANPSVTVVYLCIAAQAERIGVQLVFGEKGEEALMGAAAFTRGSEAAVLLIQITVATATSEPERHSRAGHHVVVYLRTLIAHNTHTHTFSPTNEAFRTPPIRPAQHRCDKGSD